MSGADAGESQTHLWVWLFIQLQMILVLLYVLVRCVLCPLLGRDDAAPTPRRYTAAEVARNTADLLERAAAKKKSRADAIAAKLAQLAAPLAALSDEAFGDATPVQLFRQGVAALTLCPFSKKAAVWADPVPSVASDDPEREALAAVPALARWSIHAESKRLDAFVFARQLPRDRLLGPRAPDAPPVDSADVEVYNLAVWLRATLHALSLHDPGGSGRSCIIGESEHLLDGVPTGRRGWRFEFADEKFFVTTFTPAYGPKHPRHAVGAWSFILLQPDFSFSLTHNVGADHPPMPADAPPETWSVRERVRRRFTAAERAYYVPHAHRFPQSILYVPHRDERLAEAGWHWQWWLDAPKLANVEPRANNER